MPEYVVGDFWTYVVLDSFSCVLAARALLYVEAMAAEIQAVHHVRQYRRIHAPGHRNGVAGAAQVARPNPERAAIGCDWGS
jgi:hypothetical protein